MRKALAAALICFLLTAPLGHGFAGTAEAVQPSAVSERPLPFGRQILRIEAVEALPNGNLAVLSFSQGKEKDEEALWLDLFTASGERPLSRRLGSHRPEISAYPFAQLLIKSGKIICEYYPDITSMELCYRSSYSFTGKALRTDQKLTLRYGDAGYARNLGQFILKRQAHAYDEAPADPFTRLEIEHVPTGKIVRTKVWDFAPASFTDKANHLWIVQKNEQAKLEIRTYTASGAVTEKVVEINEPTLKAQEYAAVRSAVWHQGRARILIRSSNTEYVLLTYDLNSQQIVASSALSALPEANYVSGLMVAGAHLLAVNEIWDEAMQRQSKALSLMDEAGAQHPLRFAGQAFSVFTKEMDGALFALELDKGSGQWLLREYALPSI